jgi:hypothetical protein
MGISVFGIGKAVCDASSQLGLYSIAQSACYQPGTVGFLLSISTAAVTMALLYRYWRVSAY